MPATKLIFYQDRKGKVPVIDWLLALRKDDRKAYAGCRSALRRLGAFGHELRRPVADYLDDGIYELRVSSGKVNYRILYFFHGKNIAVVAHGLTKESRIPKVDLERAIKRKQIFMENPELHSHTMEIDHA